MPDFVLILLRSVFSFFFLLLMTRLMGKKQMSQLTFFDYVVGITIGSIAAGLSIDQSVTIINGLIGIFVWGIFPILLGFLDMKSLNFRKIVDGTPTVLIQKGKVLEKNLKKEKLTINELMLLLREKNVFKLSDVEFAVMETNGQLSVLNKSDMQPVTPKVAGITVDMEHEPRVVIMNGEVKEKTLKELGLSQKWLLEKIKAQGAKTFEDVFLAQVDSKGNVYVDLYDEES
jgi:uncharacterized membrane protein YcaP (DUF421 family)